MNIWYVLYIVIFENVCTNTYEDNKATNYVRYIYSSPPSTFILVIYDEKYEKKINNLLKIFYTFHR